MYPVISSYRVSIASKRSANGTCLIGAPICARCSFTDCMPTRWRDAISANSCSSSIGISALHRQHQSHCMEPRSYRSKLTPFGSPCPCSVLQQKWVMSRLTVTQAESRFPRGSSRIIQRRLRVRDHVRRLSYGHDALGIEPIASVKIIQLLARLGRSRLSFRVVLKCISPFTDFHWHCFGSKKNMLRLV